MNREISLAFVTYPARVQQISINHKATDQFQDVSTAFIYEQIRESEF